MTSLQPNGPSAAEYESVIKAIEQAYKNNSYSYTRKYRSALIAYQIANHVAAHYQWSYAVHVVALRSREALLVVDMWGERFGG